MADPNFFKKNLIITDLGEAGQAPWGRHICSSRFASPRQAHMHQAKITTYCFY
ncbi:Uncharacterized protein dnm_036050 [Desulfonema magnum]|uniref:Uncharacterized protein n=1 Tax=Desulfonema magnum TaxID=45655 RepID=A0A975BL93_9BACT|nr:Uncharacterized protein dnm_036050 [Desulfonema magnum]